MKCRPFWTLNKLIAAGVLGGFAFLLLDIRFEHRLVLSEKPVAWIPIVFSGTMLLLSVPSLIWWEPRGRQVLRAGFTVALAVGLLGIWFHTEGHPTEVFKVLSVWIAPGSNAASSQSVARPPVLAPLAFCGLGLFGVLACSRRFPSEPPA